MTVNASGGQPGLHDYLPFGEEIPSGVGGRNGLYGAADGVTQKFTGKERDQWAESGLNYFGARYFSAAQGRFTGADPLFETTERVSDPQQWNLYAYARNNPLRFTDPTGMDIWLEGCGKDSDTCHKNYVGTWDEDHKTFTRTHLSGDLTDSGQLGNRGITVEYGGKSYQGVWDTVKTEQNAVLLSGAGAINGFTALVTGDCNHTCIAEGTLGLPSASGGVNFFGSSEAMKALSGSSEYQKNPGLDALDFFHKDNSGFQVNFRGYQSPDQQGLPSTHIPVSSLPGQLQTFHVDARYPYEDFTGLVDHTGSMLHTLWNSIAGGGSH
jgi:RHS repeat-associated protein